ncbi:MAG: hypothetical protein JXR72_02145 [Proteobacteria bacterium]|nr:hypothetical protein [Pseudomonadota bacterium]
MAARLCIIVDIDQTKSKTNQEKEKGNPGKPSGKMKKIFPSSGDMEEQEKRTSGKKDNVKIETQSIEKGRDKDERIA